MEDASLSESVAGGSHFVVFAPWGVWRPSVPWADFRYLMKTSERLEGFSRKLYLWDLLVQWAWCVCNLRGHA